jgi:hypothetical protein
MAPKTQVLALLLSISLPLVHGVGLACELQAQGNIVDNTDCICAGASLVQNHINCDGNIIISDSNTLTYGCGSCTVGVTRYNGHGDLTFNAQLLQSWFALQAVACTSGGFQTNSITGFFQKGSSKRDESASSMRWARREPTPDALQERSCSGDTQISVFNRCTLVMGAGLALDIGRDTLALAGDGFDTLTTIMWRGMQSAAAYSGQQEASINPVTGDRVTIVADIDAAVQVAGTTWGDIVNTVSVNSLYTAIRAAVVNANYSRQRTLEFVLYDSNGSPLFRMLWNAWQEVANNGDLRDDIEARLGAASDSD